MIEATKATGSLATPVAAVEAPRPVTRQAEQSPAEESAARKAAETVEAALRNMEPPLMGQHERLSIARDEATGTFIYRSIDKATGEVIRQWPVESMLQFKAYLRHAEGVLIDSRV